MAMIFLTMMGMVLRVVGMVMALVLSLTMMGMVLTIAMVLMIAMVPHIHLTVAKAMVHLIVTKAIVQSEVTSHDLLIVDSAPKCVTCMPGQTVSVWVIMTKCSPGMGGGTV